MRELLQYRMCRLCLSTGCHLVDILEENRDEEFVVKLAVEDLLHYVVLKEALYPWLVCSICLEKLRDFHFFKRRCVENQEVYDSRIRGNIWLLNQARSTECDDIPEKSEDEGVENSMGVDSGHHLKTDVPVVDPQAPSGGICIAGTDSWGCEAGSGMLTMQDTLTQGQKRAATECLEASIPASDVRASGLIVPLLVSPSLKREEGQVKGHISNPGSRKEDEIINSIVLEEVENREAMASYNSTRQSIRVMERRKKNSVEAIESTGVPRNVRGIGVWGTVGGARNQSPLSDDNPHGRSLKCDKCGIAFSSKYSIGKHMMVCNVLSVFKCSTCNLDFDHEVEYKGHKCAQGKINSRTLCNADKRVPDSASSGPSNDSIQDVNPIVKKLLLPGVSPKSLSKSSNLAARIHTHNRKRLYSCRVCGRPYTQKRFLKTHMMLHNGTKPYSCNQCSKSFSKTQHLDRHMSVHTGLKPFTCSHCSKSFSCKPTLQRHIMTVHTSLRPFSCSHCSKSFSLKNYLHKHMAVHTGIKPFSCSHCSKSFARKTNLDRHMYVHTGLKAFTCSHCSKTFSQKSNLHIHMTVHTGLKAFSCSLCSKSFAHKQTLRHHMSVHTSLKAFTCSHCSKSFSHKKNLSSHMSVHTGLKAFSSSHCLK